MPWYAISFPLGDQDGEVLLALSAVISLGRSRLMM